MYGLLGSGNIWQRYNYFKFWNLRTGCKKNLKIKNIAFKVVQMKFLAIHITYQKFLYIYGKKLILIFT